MHRNWIGEGHRIPMRVQMFLCRFHNKMSTMGLKLLAETRITALVEVLLKYSPITNVVVGRLRGSLGKKRTVQCYVDEFPHRLNTVVIRVPGPMASESSLTVFAKDVSKFRQLVATERNIFDWTKPQKISALQLPLSIILRDHLSDCGAVYTRGGPYNLLLHPEVVEHQNIALPRGYKFGVLKEAHSEYVTSTWQFAGAETDRYVRLIISNYECVCIETEGGELVGWYMEQPDGSQGMLHVKPTFRGQGLSKCLVQKLKYRLAAMGKPLFLYSAPDNDASIGIHLSNGYVITHEQHEWLHVAPGVLNENQTVL